MLLPAKVKNHGSQGFELTAGLEREASTLQHPSQHTECCTAASERSVDKQLAEPVSPPGRLQGQSAREQTDTEAAVLHFSSFRCWPATCQGKVLNFQSWTKHQDPV